MSDFPPSSLKEDSKYFSESAEDTTMKAETDGGYAFTRKRHTRRPRKTFRTGFTDLSNSQKAALESFYDARVGALSFTYTHPVSLVEYVVRFKDGQGLSFKYAGFGDNPRWDIGGIELVEV